VIILVLFVVVSAVVSVEGLQVSVVSAEEAIVKSERNEEKKGLKLESNDGTWWFPRREGCLYRIYSVRIYETIPIVSGFF
jgi:hypothetical protein